MIVPAILLGLFTVALIALMTAYVDWKEKRRRNR